MRCFSVHPGSSRWPRRKSCTRTRGALAISCVRGRAKRYSTEVSEGAFDTSQQDIPFLDGFPDRLIREGLPTRLKRKSIRKDFAIEDIWSPLLDESITAGELSHEETEHNLKPGEASHEVDGESLSGSSGQSFPLDSSTLGPAIASPNSDYATQDSQDGPIENVTMEEIEALAEPGLTSPILAQSPEVPATQFPHNALPQNAVISSAVERPFAEASVVQPIHIIGAGRLGKYVAHSVASLPFAPPVTLILHTGSLMKRWHDEGRAIKILRHGRLYIQDQVRVEFAGAPGRGFRNFQAKEPASSVIKNLIVTTDGFQTLPALTAIRDRLQSSSTILFLQDGMGIIDEVNQKVFPDPMTRPNYALGSIEHKLTPTERVFTLIEKEAKGGALSVQIRSTSSNAQPSQQHSILRRLDGTWRPFMFLMRTLARSPELKVATLARPDFLMKQLQNLAVNSIIGPLSVLYDCSNGELLNNNMVFQSMRLILKETSQILRSLPEISRVSKIHEKFSARKLEAIVVSVIKMTDDNSSVMLQDVKAGRRTSMGFYNGYLVRRATELGIACPHNEMLLTMVRAKQEVMSKKAESYIPLRGEY